jgi:hypothetical protein
MQFFLFFFFYLLLQALPQQQQARAQQAAFVVAVRLPCLTSNNTCCLKSMTSEPPTSVYFCVCAFVGVYVCQHSRCACVCLWEHVCVCEHRGMQFFIPFFPFFSAPVRRQSSRSASIAGCCMSMPIKTSSWRRSPAYDEPVYT